MSKCTVCKGNVAENEEHLKCEKIYWDAYAESQEA